MSFKVETLKPKYIAACLVSFVIAVIAFAWGMTAWEKGRAESLLHDISNLELGKSTFADAQRIAGKYGGTPWYSGSENKTCSPQRCELRFSFSNRFLTSLHLARHAELIANISVKDGIVVGRDVGYARDSGRFNQLGYEVIDGWLWKEDEMPSQQRTPGLWRLNVEQDGSEGVASTVIVRLSSTSSPDQRRRAYSLDLSCLDKLFGCSHRSTIFPAGIPYRGPPYQTHTESW